MKQPQPWYWDKRQGWYVQIGGKQSRLVKGPKAETEKAAWDAFYKLKGEAPPLPALPKEDKILVGEVIILFLEANQDKVAPRTLKWYREFLFDFAKGHDKLPVKELKPFHVSRWLDAHKSWTACRRHAVIAVKRAFNWAEKEGVLTVNPIKSVSKPPATIRPNILAKEQRQEILEAIPDVEFRQFVEAMQESGARPSEISKVTVEDVNLELGVWVLKEHKSSKKTVRPRVIYLSPRLQEITKELVEKHETGPLFRSQKTGRPWGMHGVISRFRRIREKLPHLKNAVAYAFRHGYATEALINGVGVAQVAELLGHRDTSMVTMHYSHLAERTEYMRELAAKAVKGDKKSKKNEDE